MELPDRIKNKSKIVSLVQGICVIPIIAIAVVSLLFTHNLIIYAFILSKIFCCCLLICVIWVMSCRIAFVQLMVHK